MSSAFEALYVANTEDVEDELDERETAKLQAARAMLEQMDLAVASTVDA